MSISEVRAPPPSATFVLAQHRRTRNPPAAERLSRGCQPDSPWLRQVHRVQRLPRYRGLPEVTRGEQVGEHLGDSHRRSKSRWRPASLKSYLTSGLAGGSGQSRGSHGSRGSALTTGTASALLSGLSLCRTQSHRSGSWSCSWAPSSGGVAALLQII